MSASSSTRRTLNFLLAISVYSLENRSEFHLLFYRQRKAKHAAFARLTFQPDLSTVQFHQSFRNRQPKARSPRLLLLRLSNLVELIENSSGLFRRNTGTCVLYRHFHRFISVSVERDSHFAECWSELDRVPHKVHQNF